MLGHQGGDNVFFRGARTKAIRDFRSDLLGSGRAVNRDRFAPAAGCDQTLGDPLVGGLLLG